MDDKKWAELNKRLDKIESKLRDLYVIAWVAAACGVAVYVHFLVYR